MGEVEELCPFLRWVLSSPGGATVSRRATSAEREAVRQLLSDARVAGMITEDEWEEKVEQTAKVQDIDELQDLYAPITGATIPILALHVTSDWYTDAGVVLEMCDDLARERVNFLFWGSLPLLTVITLLVTYNEYSYEPKFPIYALLIYTVFCYFVIGVSHVRAERMARKVRHLLEEAGVG